MGGRRPAGQQCDWLAVYPGLSGDHSVVGKGRWSEECGGRRSGEAKSNHKNLISKSP